MTELTLGPLRARPRLIESTKHRLGIDTEWHLLHLHRTQERSFLLLPFLFIQLGFLPQGFLLLLFQRRTRLSGSLLLLLDLRDLFLDLGRFVFLPFKLRSILIIDAFLHM